MRAILLLLALLLAPTASEAQQVAKPWRLGWLSGGFERPDLERVFRVRLRELGYVDVQNLVIEYRYAEGKFERLPALATELVRLRVDLIVTVGTPAARAAKQATQTIPIVMAASGDAVGVGLVATLARPGGNVTGLSFLGRELGAKHLELLKETVPAMSRVAVLWDTTIGGAELKQTMESSASALGLRLQPLEARSADDYRAAFSAMSGARAEGLVVLPMGTAYTHRALIAELTAKHRLPAVYGDASYVEVGGLMSYGPNFLDLNRRAATYVDKILKGAIPANLPVEQPTKFELVINLKTAKTLGLTIPASVLLRTDHTIE
jgi:putative ABC transport system substrate-binding protein